MKYEPDRFEIRPFEVWEIRIRLIKAVAYLIAACGFAALCGVLVWLVRGA